MEHILTTELPPASETQEREHSFGSRAERSFRNRVVLGLALFAGVLAAQGASAQEVARRCRPGRVIERVAVSEKSEFRAWESQLNTAEADMELKRRSLESVYEEHGVRKVKVSYTCKRPVVLRSGGTVAIGLTLEFDRYEPGKSTPQSVREAIVKHNASVERYMSIRSSEPTAMH